MSNKLIRQNFLKSATIKYLTETPAAAENPFAFYVQLLHFFRLRDGIKFNKRLESIGISYSQFN
jgi:hypothetical protein